MMRIFLSDPDGFVSDDKRVDPFGSAFRNVATTAGHTVQNSFDPVPHACLLRNFRAESYRSARRAGLKNSQMVLFLTEPPSVHPRQYQERIINRFPHTYSRSVSRRLPRGVIQTNYFDFLRKTERGISPGTTRSREFALIQANKVSAHVDERYSFRRRLIDSLSRRNVPVVVAGAGWNRSSRDLLKSLAISCGLVASAGFRLNTDQHPLSPCATAFFGPVQSKRDFLGRFEFSLVVENQRDYVSEKLFESLEAGCITIYDGPSLQEVGLSPDIALTLAGSAEARVEQLRQLMQLDQSSIERIRTTQQLALRSDSVSSRDTEVAKQLLASIEGAALSLQNIDIG